MAPLDPQDLKRILNPAKAKANRVLRTMKGSPPRGSKAAEQGPDHILVIRLGALGDIVLCFQAFHEIRRAHPNAEIAFLTMPAFADFARHMPWFNRVIVDPRPSSTQIGQWLKLANDIKLFKPKRVYDLQGKLRQTILFALLRGPLGSQWSGAAPFCSHPRLREPRPGMHFTEFVAAQLQLADVAPQPPADLTWLDDPLDGFSLPPRFAVLVSGSTPRRRYKRWPARNYADLAGLLQAKGIASVAIGTKEDKDQVSAIRAAFPGLIDFCGRTTLMQVAALMRRAVCVVANDTGPMHIAAALGVPTLGLMSEQVDAAWSAPRGPRAKWLQGRPLASLDPDKVFLALQELLDQKAG